MDLLKPNMTLLDLEGAIAKKYDLDNNITFRLVLPVKVPGSKEGKHKNQMGTDNLSLHTY